MIEINLLPASMRKPESTPLPRLLLTYAGIAICCGFGVVCFHLGYNVLPDKQDKLDRKTDEVKKLQLKARKLVEFQTEIDGIKLHVDAVKELYAKRRIWSKILYDTKKIVTLESKMDYLNKDRRYLWLHRFKYDSGRRGQTLVLEGYATARTAVDEFEIVKTFIKNLREYTPPQSPEDEKREELAGKIKALEMARKKAQEADPEFELPAKTKKQKDLEKQLGALGGKKSGAIATKPFMDFFKGRINLSSTTFVVAPAATDSLDGALHLPYHAHNFILELPLIVPGEDEGP